MTDEEILQNLSIIWHWVEIEANHSSDLLHDTIQVLRERLKELRETEWKYKELCK